MQQLYQQEAEGAKKVGDNFQNTKDYLEANKWWPKTRTK